MDKEKEAIWGRVYPHIGSILLAAASVVLVLTDRALWAVGALGVAALSYLITRHLVRRLVKAHEQQCLLDDKLVQSQKLASIGELSAGIGHEINNPLAIISQEAEWVQHLLKNCETKVPGEIKDLTDSVREISRQVDRCREITQSLLNFARKMEPVIQGVNVNKLIEDMAKLVEKEAVANDIRIVRDYQPDLPLVFTDPPCLRQVVLNLLSNAKHAVERKGIIRIATRASGDNSVEIAVEDTGCGIPREHLHKIFDPFFTTKPEGKGTGLGLSICHGIVERLGGTISVTSEVGNGSAFVVRLPIQQKKGMN